MVQRKHLALSRRPRFAFLLERSVPSLDFIMVWDSLSSGLHYCPGHSQLLPFRIKILAEIFPLHWEVRDHFLFWLSDGQFMALTVSVRKSHLIMYKALHTTACAEYLLVALSWSVSWQFALAGLTFGIVTTLRTLCQSIESLLVLGISTQHITSWFSGAALLFREKILKSLSPRKTKIKHDQNDLWESLEPFIKYSIKVGIPPSTVMYGSLHIVKCEVLINSADIVYCVPGAFPGPGNTWYLLSVCSRSQEKNPINT